MDRLFDLDGYFHISVTKEGVFLTVYSPVGEGEKVDLKEVLAQIEKHKLTDIDFDKVRQVVEEASGMPVAIGGKQKEEVGETKILVEISDDLMKAYVTLIPPPIGSVEVSVEDIKKELEAKGVIYGVNEALLNEIIKKQKLNEPILIAQGTPIVRGRNATLEYKFKRDRKISLREGEDGRVDFRELDLLVSATAGQVLVEKRPPTRGVPGMTVTGQKLETTDGMDVALPVGKNTKVSSNGLELISEIDGHVVCSPSGRVDVEPIYGIPGDVDLQTGNINFKGTVSIGGNVKDGFSVKATGDINVRGCVERSLIKADGDVIIQSGILGKGEGVVEAGGSIIAKFAENVTLSSKKDVIITEAIMHSNVDAGGKVIVKGGRGAILGGKIRAGEEVNANDIGSWTEIQTDIEVGVDPEVREEIQSLEREIEEGKKKFNELKLGIKTLLEQKEKCGGKLPPEKEELLDRHIKARNLIMARLRGATERFPPLQRKMFHQRVTGGKVCAFNTVYPGVNISIGQSTLTVKQEYKYVTFFLKAGEIEIGPYEEARELRKKEWIL